MCLSLHWLAFCWAVSVQYVCVSSLAGLLLDRRCGVCVYVCVLVGLLLGNRFYTVYKGTENKKEKH